MFPKTCCNMFQPGGRHNIYQRRNYNFAAAAALACRCFWLFNGILSKFGVRYKAIPHNSKCRYGERGAAAAKPKAQIILNAAKVSAASGGNSEPKQGQRSQSARGFCPRSTMRVPQPDIIEHFGNADAVPQLPERCLSRKAGIVRYCLKLAAENHPSVTCGDKLPAGGMWQRDRGGRGAVCAGREAA